MIQNFMVQGRLFRGSQENSPEGTPYLLGGVINPVLALQYKYSDYIIKYLIYNIFRTVKVDQFNRIISNFIGTPLDQEVK